MIDGERCATLPFPWALRSHCRVIHGPDFKTVVTREGRKRDGVGAGEGGWSVEQSEHTHFLIHHLVWGQILAPKTTVAVTPNTTDHGITLTNNNENV